MSAGFCSDTPQQPVKKDSLGFMTKLRQWAILFSPSALKGAFDLLELRR
jgi:hypothetical protein